MSPNIGNKEIFAQNLSRYMNERGIDRNTLCEKLDFKYSTLCEWLSARKYPRIDSIEKMANYFGIQKSDLIESHAIKDSEQSNISEIHTENIYNIPSNLLNSGICSTSLFLYTLLTYYILILT